MKLFQNSGVYPAYIESFNDRTYGITKFSESRDAFIADRYGACHFLQPVLEGHSSAFFTNGNDPTLQGKWAKENGLPRNSKLVDILLAQIENHRTEVFYNLDPMRYGSDFVRKLPSCVKHSIAWRAAPSPGADFSAYSLLVCNFPSILNGYAAKGWRTAYFSPAHDPVMDIYAANTERPVDVLFVGGYSRHHRQRAEVLEAVAAEREHFRIAFHLDRSRLTKMAESPLGRIFPLAKHRRPKDIVAVSCEPVFGLDLYKALSQAKIVLNGAVDMAGLDRGNMRCFEAMGCGAAMISDAGNYPKGMISEQTLLLYQDSKNAVEIIRMALANPGKLEEMAKNGHSAVSTLYSKTMQWEMFNGLISEI
jgi:hypothetical protein